MRYRTKPFPHQQVVLEGGTLHLKNPARELVLKPTMDRASYGLFHEPGLGKSKSAIDFATHLLDNKHIDGVVILAPNGVHRCWELDELPTHMPEDLIASAQTFCWSTQKSTSKTYQNAAADFLKWNGPLAVVAMSYDALMTAAGERFLWHFVKKRRCLMIGDELHFVKSPGAKRTIRTLAASKYATFRRGLTGTLVDNCAFDVYSQLKFIDPDCWKAIGCDNNAAFKAMFGVFQRRPLANNKSFDELVDYRNLDVLHRIVDQYGSRLRKDDLLDLPPKNYIKRYYELTPIQRTCYDDLREDFLTLHSGGLLTAPLAITRMIRLQQVTSGYLPTDADKEVVLALGDKNPRIDLLMDVMEEVKGVPTIVWGKYNEDIRLIMEAFAKAGISAVRYDGTVDDDQKLEAKERFQKKGDVQVFVSKTSVGGTGLTLTRAHVEIFYNTTFGLGKRIQAEDRVHRIGLEHPLTIYDLIATNTIDGYIIKNLRDQRDTARVVMGDPVSAWI